MACKDLEEMFETGQFLEEKATDSELYRQFELTYQGQPICINEYATWIAEEINTHVIQLDDRFDLKVEYEVYKEYIEVFETMKISKETLSMTTKLIEF